MTFPSKLHTAFFLCDTDITLKTVYTYNANVLIFKIYLSEKWSLYSRFIRSYVVLFSES